MRTRKKNRIVLVTGGARAGKTIYAMRLAGKWWKRPAYLATAEGLDREMAERIRRHRQSRGARWTSVEEAVNVAPFIRNGVGKCDGILLDCLTMWLSNVLGKEGEGALSRRCLDLAGAIAETRQDVILVANEVGSGIVPANRMARIFRDAAGRLNQDLAGIATAVVLVVAGVPVVLKGKVR